MRSCWSSCWGGAGTTCGERGTAARRWPWRPRGPSTCCCWTSTCRSWTASRSPGRSARERATGGHLPVIALTGRARKEDRERCLAAGMDDFLAKPIQAGDLWAAIDRAVRRDEGQQTVDEGTTTIPSPLSRNPLPSSLLDPQVL